MVHGDAVFSYCDEHRAEVTIGISEYALKGTLNKIMEYKMNYMANFKSAAYMEFEKCKHITEDMHDNDSSVTEQPL
jgi:hypothetical protein